MNHVFVRQRLTIALVGASATSLVAGYLAGKGHIEILLGAVLGFVVLAAATRAPEIPWAMFASGLFILVFLPVDLGPLHGRVAFIALVIALAATAASRLLRRHWHLPAPGLTDLALVGFSVVLLLSSARSPSSAYASSKVQGWLLFTLLPFLGVRYLYCPSEEDLWRLAKLFALVSLIGAVAIVYTSVVAGSLVPSARWIQRILLIEEWGVNLFDLTDAFSLGIPCATAIVLWRSGPSHRWGWALVAMLAFYAQLTVGKRVQTVTTVIACLMLLWWWQNEKSALRGRVRTLLVLACAGLLALIVVYVAMWNMKLEWILQDVSLWGRLEHFRQSLDLSAARPFLGYGTGSYSILMKLGDTRYFPHNVFLEVLVENGLSGLALVTMLSLVPLVRGVRCLSRGPAGAARVVILMLALFVIRLLIGMFSTDIMYWRIGLWAALLVTACDLSSATQSPETRMLVCQTG